MTRQGNRTSAVRGRLLVPGALVSLAMIVAACGGGDASTPVGGDTVEVTEPETATTVAGDAVSSTTAAVEPESGPATTTDPDAPAAPDFTLALGEGGEFVLSAETRPVYLVFWAEW